MSYLDAILAPSAQYTAGRALPIPVSYSDVDEAWVYDPTYPEGVLVWYTGVETGDVYTDGEVAPNYDANPVELEVTFVSSESTGPVSNDEVRITTSAGEDTMLLIGTFREGGSAVLQYEAGFGGTIDGEAMQTGNLGTTGAEVLAVPVNGFEFVEWSDGLTTPARTDTIDNNKYYATFRTIGYSVNVFSQYQEEE